MKAIGDARLYLVSGATISAGPLVDFVEPLARAGVDVVQLREKEMEAGDLLRVAHPLRDACAAAGIPFIVNDRPDVAVTVGADGVHLGQNDLPVAAARRIVGRSIVGRSTHEIGEVDRSADEDVDYIAVGPVYETPTKPGRPAAGLDLIRHAASSVSMPWFAIGGLDEQTLPAAIEAGARRAVVVRAITRAADPSGAAARLKEMLAAVSR